MDDPVSDFDSDAALGGLPWPDSHADLLAGDNEWWLVACLDWPRGRWIGYIGGYRKAAALILDDVVKTRHSQDYLIYPFLMCWRHYSELQLKTLLALLHRYRREPGQLLKTHKLDVLWRHFRTMFEKSVQEDVDLLNNVERILLQLNSFDPTSEHFRYPVGKDESQTLGNLPRVHMRKFHQAMEAVANFLDGADTGLRVSIENQEDYLNEMRFDI